MKAPDKPILQCERCDRLCSADGAALLPQPVWFGVPMMIVCADCKEGKVVSGVGCQVSGVEGKKNPEVASVKAKVCRSNGALTRAARCLRSEPREDSRLPAEPDYVGVVNSTQAEYKAAVDTGETCRKILEFLQEHYGQWVPMVKLIEVGGVIAVHSRMPEIRGMLPQDHDIDQKSLAYEPTGKAHSHYRLCLKTESERLKRKAEQGEELF